jgi:hypothetical protein
VSSLRNVGDHQPQEKARDGDVDGDPIIDTEEKQRHQRDDEAGNQSQMHPPP